MEARRWSGSLERYRDHALVMGTTERGAPSEVVVRVGELAHVAEAALREARRLARTEPGPAFGRTCEAASRVIWRAYAAAPDDRAARAWFAEALLELVALARRRLGAGVVEVALLTNAPTAKDGY